MTSAARGQREQNYAEKPCNSGRFWLSANVGEGGDGAQGRNRTTDTVIFSHVLYQLSYLGAAPRRLKGRAPRSGRVIRAAFRAVQRPCEGLSASFGFRRLHPGSRGGHHATKQLIKIDISHRIECAPRLEGRRPPRFHRSGKHGGASPSPRSKPLSGKGNRRQGPRRPSRLFPRPAARRNG